MRQGKPNDLDTPNDEFAKIDQMLPKKKGQSPQDRAKEIESALDWLRQNNISPADEDFPDKFNKIGSIPVSKRSPEDRKKDTDTILNWMRSGMPDSDDTPDGDFKKLDQLLPRKKGQITSRQSQGNRISIGLVQVTWSQASC